MKTTLLRLYSTTMWKLYNTPVARKTAEYVVGVIEYLMTIVFITFFAIILISNNYERNCLFITIALLVINQVIGMLQVRKLNTILALEQEGRTEAAEEISATVCRTIKICSICLIVAQVIIFVYYMYV